MNRRKHCIVGLILSAILTTSGSSQAPEHPKDQSIDAASPIPVAADAWESPAQLRHDTLGKTRGTLRIDAQGIEFLPNKGATIRWPFVQMTARLMEQFGQPALTRIGEDRFVVAAGTPYRMAGGTYAIEPDATAASYFLALPLVVGGSLAHPSRAAARERPEDDVERPFLVRRSPACPP